MTTNKKSTGRIFYPSFYGDNTLYHLYYGKKSVYRGFPHCAGEWVGRGGWMFNPTGFWIEGEGTSYISLYKPFWCHLSFCFNEIKDSFPLPRICIIFKSDSFLWLVWYVSPTQRIALIVHLGLLELSYRFQCRHDIQINNFQVIIMSNNQFIIIISWLWTMKNLSKFKEFDHCFKNNKLR